MKMHINSMPNKMKTHGIDMKKLTFGINTNVFAVNYTQFSHKYASTPQPNRVAYTRQSRYFIISIPHTAGTQCHKTMS